MSKRDISRITLSMQRELIDSIMNGAQNEELEVSRSVWWMKFDRATVCRPVRRERTTHLGFVGVHDDGDDVNSASASGLMGIYMNRFFQYKSIPGF